MPEINPIRPTTPEAIQLAKNLLRTSRYGAIAVFDAATGRPLASRVAVATDTNGTPLILVSGLAAHTTGLLANPACSLLLGEVGKGDPSPTRVSHCIARRRKSKELHRIIRAFVGAILTTTRKGHSMRTWEILSSSAWNWKAPA